MSDGENTQVLRRAGNQNVFIAYLLKWQPVIIRGGLYFCIAFLSPMVVEIKNVGAHVIVDDWGWLNWAVLILESSLAGLIAVRIYMDGSFSRHSEKLKE